MKSITKLWAFAVVAAFGLACVSTAVASCDTVAVCTDVQASFWGTIGGDGITVGWETDDETTAVSVYRVLRYDCGNPATCSEFVANVLPTGTCANVEEYEYEDGDGDDTYIYTVEVWSSGTRKCAFDVDPE